jgi:hypothetical protein
MTWLLAGLIIVSLIAGGGAVVAADDAVPGDALYGLDQALESAQLSVASNGAARANLQKTLAEERLQEAAALEAVGKTELSQEAFVQYEALITAVDPAFDLQDSLDDDDDDPEPTATATMTPTVTITPTVTVTPTVTLTPEPIVTDCTGNEQPHAQTLADKYEVSYDEIMGWFCDGNGFGEIEHAYDLSLVDGQSVAEIFALREAGAGWGQIKKEIGGSPSDNAPGQQNRPDNNGNNGNIGNNENRGNSDGNNGNQNNNGNQGNNENRGNSGNNNNGNGNGNKKP